MDQVLRKQRHKRIRSKVTGTSKRPRLTVYRSNVTMRVQLIDDTSSHTIGAATGSPQEIAKKLREDAPDQKAIVFDRSGYKYHGRIKILADALRESGFTF